MNNIYLAVLTCVFVTGVTATACLCRYLPLIQQASLGIGNYIFLKLPETLQHNCQRVNDLSGGSVNLPFYYCFCICSAGVIWLAAQLMNSLFLNLFSCMVITAISYHVAVLIKRARLCTREVVIALPAQLDLLAMLLAAGLPVMSALQKSTAVKGENRLRHELRGVLTRIRAGAVPDDEFKRLAKRYDTRELNLFISALKYARQSGTGLAFILKEQARHRRHELFVAAEQQALEAPVKLMLPLVTCVFPGALIVLVVVVTAKLMWGL